jgi:CRP-like cAMP-binding protein
VTATIATTRTQLQNHVLASLPSEVSDRLRPYMAPVQLVLGEILYDRGERPEFVYFPVDAVASLLCMTSDGGSAAIGVTGRDGAVGITPFLGISTASHRAIVQMAGSAFRVRSGLLQTEFHENKMVQSTLLRCVQDLLTQISQTVVCNRLHQVEKRLCRWLLLTHDRAKSDQLVMTQEFISHLLGSRRESVTVAAARLQDAGLINYARGKIAILDRAGLESAACECYQAVRDEIEFSSPKKPCQPVIEADNRRLSNLRS